MLFDLIFLSLFVAGWVIAAAIPWLVLSIATRGQAGLANLPICVAAGVVAALAVPLLGKDDAAGLVLSFVLAALASTAVLAARRFSMRAELQVRRARDEAVPK